jgi:hypothetical protein
LKTTSGLAVLAVVALSAASARASSWTFTKLMPGQAFLPVAPQAQGIEALAFEVTSADTAAVTVTRMGFMITGTLPIGSLSDFELVSYPNGLNAPGVVVGKNDGSTWPQGPKKFTIDVPLSTPLALGSSRATFVLRANVKAGGAAYFFNPDLHTVTVSEGGVERLLIGETEDLPLPGDIFNVN